MFTYQINPNFLIMKAIDTQPHTINTLCMILIRSNLPDKTLIFQSIIGNHGPSWSFSFIPFQLSMSMTLATSLPHLFKLHFEVLAANIDAWKDSFVVFHYVFMISLYKCLPIDMFQLLFAVVILGGQLVRDGKSWETNKGSASH